MQNVARRLTSTCVQPQLLCKCLHYGPNQDESGIFNGLEAEPNVCGMLPVTRNGPGQIDRRELECCPPAGTERSKFKPSSLQKE